MFHWIVNNGDALQQVLTLIIAVAGGFATGHKVGKSQ
jgi:hypothetical protein